jgi:membrane protease subunit HflC
MINRLLVPIFALVFVLALVAFACTYTVRFTETAVRTTFGAADEGSVKESPGLYFKAPYPFQSVTKYDKRVQLVQTRSETQLTSDDFQVVVEGYATYRVSDPLLFFRSFSSAGDRAVDHFRKAENDVLRDRLRSALGETSKYSMDDLFTPNRGESKLPELEQRVLSQLQQGGVGGVPLEQYGIEVVSVGIDRVVLPQDTTDKVMQRMGAARDRLAQRLESEGQAIATAIEAEARAKADKIRAFAQRRAADIRARGELEAVPFLAQQRENEDLAVFLRSVDFMRDSAAKRFTLVLSSSDFGLGVFSPDVLDELRAGQIPPAGGNTGGGMPR